VRVACNAITSQCRNAVLRDDDDPIAAYRAREIPLPQVIPNLVGDDS
jgi:hypothetical protein